MALTVTSVQAALARRLGEYAGLVDLVDLLAVGYRSAGLRADVIGVLADADLVRVTSANLDQILDVAQAEGLERILVNLDPLRLRELGILEDPAAIAARLRPLAAAFRARVDRAYGIGERPVVGGVLTYDFAQRADEADLGGELG